MAKQLLHVLGYPLVVVLKTIIKMNAIWNNLVTKSNLKLMNISLGLIFPLKKAKPQDNTRTSLSAMWCLFLMNYVMPNMIYASILT